MIGIANLHRQRAPLHRVQVKKIAYPDATRVGGVR